MITIFTKDELERISYLLSFFLFDFSSWSFLFFLFFFFFFLSLLFLFFSFFFFLGMTLRDAKQRVLV